MFHPKAPNLFRSMTVEWKKHRPNKMHLILGSFSSTSSLGKYVKALFMFALIPEGGSLVSLMDLSRMPIGTPVEGYADSSSLKFMCDPPVSPENESNIFSSYSSQRGIR
jgi:hypothetical protein